MAVIIAQDCCKRNSNLICMLRLLGCIYTADEYSHLSSFTGIATGSRSLVGEERVPGIIGGREGCFKREGRPEKASKAALQIVDAVRYFAPKGIVLTWVSFRCPWVVERGKGFVAI